MIRHKLDRSITAGSVIVLTLSAATLAVSGYPPGWEYGRLNCGGLGNPPITNLQDCLACCNSGEAAQVPLPPASWLIDCHRYCNSNPWI